MIAQWDNNRKQGRLLVALVGVFLVICVECAFFFLGIQTVTFLLWAVLLLMWGFSRNSKIKQRTAGPLRALGEEIYLGAYLLTLAAIVGAMAPIVITRQEMGTQDMLPLIGTKLLTSVAGITFWAVLKREADDLDALEEEEEDRRQLMVALAMEQAANAATGFSDQLVRIQTQCQSLAAEQLAGLSRASCELTEQQREATTQIRHAVKGWQEASQAMAQLKSIAEDLRNLMLASRLGELPTAMATLIQAGNESKEVLADTAGAVGQLKSEAVEFAAALKSTRTNLDKLPDYSKEIVAATKQLTKHTTTLGEKSQAASDALGGIAARVQDLSDRGIPALSNEINRAAAAVAPASEGITALGNQSLLAATHLTSLQPALQQLPRLVGALPLEALRDQATQLGLVLQQLRTAEVATLAEQMRLLPGAFQAMSASMERIGGLQDEFRVLLASITETLGRLRESADSAALVLPRLVPELRRTAEALEQLPLSPIRARMAELEPALHSLSADGLVRFSGSLSENVALTETLVQQMGTILGQLHQAAGQMAALGHDAGTARQQISGLDLSPVMVSANSASDALTHLTHQASDARSGLEKLNASASDAAVAARKINQILAELKTRPESSRLDDEQLRLLMACLEEIKTAIPAPDNGFMGRISQQVAKVPSWWRRNTNGDGQP